MRQYSIIRLKEEVLDIFSQNPVLKDKLHEHFLYLGEIPNMPEHCVICIDNQISYGWHIYNFEEVPEEDV